LRLVFRRGYVISHDKEKIEMQRGKRRILIQRPVVDKKRNQRLKESLKRYLSPGFEIDVRNVAYGGMDSVEGRYYMAVTTPYVIEEILKAEKRGYDAVIPNCFIDPGMMEAREMVRIPVVGPGESSFHIACMLGSRLGVVTVGGTYRTERHGAVISLILQSARTHGLSDRLVSVRTIGYPVEDTVKEEVILEALERESKKVIEDGAEVLILGCTGMTGYAEELQRRIDVPVVDPSVAALKVAELMITMNLKPSKLTTPSPRDVGAVCEMKYPPTLKGYLPR
jgi:allantoin racemase